MVRFKKTWAIALAAAAAICMVICSPLLAQGWQKNKKCFHSWHQHDTPLNTCRLTQSGACAYNCFRGLIYYGECLKAEGYECRFAYGPGILMGYYASCSPTMAKTCVCNDDWARWDGWITAWSCETRTP